MSRKFPVALPEGYIEFYKSLETWQNEQQIKLKKQYSPEKIDVGKLSHSSRPTIIKSIDFNIDSKQYKTLYVDLLNQIKKHRQDISGNIDNILEKADLMDFDTIPAKLLDDDQRYFHDLSLELGISQELLIFTLDHALRPFLRLFAFPYFEDIANNELHSWQFSNSCPFCGSKAHISRLKAPDGLRFMFCDRCFSEWETRYLYCVHCGNDEPGTINYITIEEDDGAYQVYTCDICKGYLKTYDERIGGKPTDLFIANIETIYLDMLAQERGYNNHDND